MLTSSQAIEKVRNYKKELDKAQEKDQEAIKRTQEFMVLLEFLAGSFDHLSKLLKNDNHVTVKNLPAIQRVAGRLAVEGMAGLMLKLDEVKKQIKDNAVEFPDVQEVKGKVTVENQVTIPEVKIPAPYKRVDTDVQSLPKYVREELEAIKKAIASINVSPVIDVAPAEVEIDMEGVKEQIATLRGAIEKIQPEVNIDLDKVENAVNDVKKAISTLTFPVPNFHSSYDHSLDMRAKNYDKRFTYNSSGDVSKVEFDDEDGGTYQKTFTYDGSGNITSRTGWVRA